MVTTAPASTVPSESGRTAKVTLPWSSWACLLLAGGIVLYPLSCSWSYISNYSYGWWVPLLALILFAERWDKRPAPESASRPALGMAFLLVWALLFLALRMALEVSMVARPLVLAVALLYVAALLAWFWIYGGMAWARYFAFPCFFLLLSVPWPIQIENPIVQGLAPFNAWLVAHALVDFGILAQATGQVIILPHCTLGVKEACSGLRSLQAALMIAFLIGELYRFTWPRRIQIVLLALGLALAGNFLRTLFLALIANSQGVAAMTEWHDTAGASILVFTSVTTFLVSYLLHRSGGQQAAPLAPKSVSSVLSLPPESVALRFAAGILIAAVAVELATQGWYGWRESGSSLYPTWAVQVPSSDPYKEVAIDKESSDILKYDAGREIQWQDTAGWSWTAYWFRYHQKAWAVSAFTNHNPDKCLPAVGYHRVKDYDPFTVELQGAPLEVHAKVFSWEGNPIYVFWVVYADRVNFPLEEAVGAPNDGILAKGRFYLSSIWHGRRGSTSETESLETILIGPSTFEEAKAAYLEQLHRMIVPEQKLASNPSPNP